MTHRIKVIPVLTAALLSSLILVQPPVLQSAEAVTTNISTDTTWSSKSISASDTVNIISGAILDITGIVHVYGTIVIESGEIYVAPSGILDIESGGAIIVHPGANLIVDGDVYVDGLLAVSGTLTVNHQYADVEVGNTLTIYSGGKLDHNSGKFDVLNTGKLEIKSGGIANTQVSTTTFLRGTLSISGTFNVNAGDVRIPGVAYIYGVLNVNAGKLEAQTAGQLNVYGNLNVNSGGNLAGSVHVPEEFYSKVTVFSGGKINVNSGGRYGSVGDVIINSGGTLNVAGVGDFDYRTLQNSGILNVNSGGVVGVTLIDVNNGGVLNVKSGGTLNSVASFVADSGSTVNVDGVVNRKYNPGWFSAVDGILNINTGGTVNADGLLPVRAGGKINDFGMLRVNTGGVLQIMGISTSLGTVEVKSSGKLEVNSGQVKIDDYGFIYIIGNLDVKSNGIVDVNNHGRLTIGPYSTNNVRSGGTINVNSGGGVIENGPISLYGKFDIKTGGSVRLWKIITVFSGGSMSNAGTIRQECGGAISLSGGSFSGTPPLDVCYPKTHMTDTTASSGVNLSNGGNTIIGERVTSTSQLKGDKIDQITIRLKKYGSPTGNAIVGIFDSTGTLKKQFALKDVSTLTTTFSDYTFTLGGGALYTVASGDRIGIKYTGGNAATNYITVMRDTNSADPFDGTNSHYQQFKGGTWSGTNTHDVYMILKQTHA